MKYPLAHLRTLMVRACRSAEVPEESIDTVVGHYLLGETQGRSSHGVAKFCFEARFFPLRQGPPCVVREHGVLAVVDARREIGPVSAEFAVATAADRARRLGAGIVGVINTQRYGVLAPWAERLAEQGLLGLVMNTSRAESTVEGARTPFLGVNPVGFAVPTDTEPLVVDMSTTRSPMGLLWEARRGNAELPADSFVTEHGVPTDDPHKAVAALVFGGHKGFALSLLVQIMTGSLFGFPMGPEVDSTWTTGYTFVAVDPCRDAASGGFAADNARLVRAMESVATTDGQPLRIPGRRSRAHRHAVLAAGELDLPEPVYHRLRARAAGDFTSD